jgi:glutamate synthase domain-containing protein 3
MVKIVRQTGVKVIDTAGVSYQQLNDELRVAMARGVKRIELHNVCGQRYIGTDLDGQVKIDVFGYPGNDLGAFMNGPRIIVHGNAQDGCGNTMNEGDIVVHGRAGDIVGLSARGGKIFVRDSVGYRAGIHMKEYLEKRPAIVIGGTAQDFAGEYMAGGVLVLLGLNLKDGEAHQTSYIGTGMHGGVIYLRGSIEPYRLGKEVGVGELEEKDHSILRPLISEFAANFEYKAEDLLSGHFVKLYPRYLRPYGRLYAY